MRQLFFLTFLIPSFLFALSEKECKGIRTQSISSWNTCNRLASEINQVPAFQDLYIQLLDQSILHCQAAISYCDIILNDLANKSQKRKKDRWRAEMQGLCLKDKKAFVERLQELQQVRELILPQRALVLYQQSLQIADRAYQLTQIPHQIENVDEASSALQEASALYREAAALAELALQWVDTASEDFDKTYLLEALVYYTQAAEHTQELAANWPQDAAFQIPPIEQGFAPVAESPFDAQVMQHSPALEHVEEQPSDALYIEQPTEHPMLAIIEEQPSDALHIEQPTEHPMLAIIEEQPSDDQHIEQPTEHPTLANIEEHPSDALHIEQPEHSSGA